MIHSLKAICFMLLFYLTSNSDKIVGVTVIYYLENSPLLINEMRIVSESDQNFDLFTLQMNKDLEPIISELEHDTEDYYPIYSCINDYKVNILSRLANRFACLASVFYSENDTQAIIESDICGYGRLWLNGHLLAVVNQRQLKRYDECRIKKGKNTLVFEHFLREKTEFAPYIYFQIYPEGTWEKQIIIEQKPLLLKSVSLIAEFDEYRQALVFMLFGSRMDRAVQSVKLVTLDESIEIKCEQNRKCVYQFASVPKMFSLYILNESTGRETERFTYVSEKYKQSVFAKAQGFVQKNKKNISDILGRINRYENPLTFDNERYDLLKEINDICENNMSVEAGVERKIYYLSEIDGTYQELVMKLPINFSAHKRYSLMFCFGILSFDYYIPKHELSDDILVVNCSGRGILGGGYISEACYLEALYYVKKHFKIDTNRIYFTGKSNGGYAVWSFLENRPDIAAAAFPVSGFPYMRQIQNVMNTYICNCISNLDNCYIGHELDIKRTIDGKKYWETKVFGMIHHAVTEFYLHKIPEFFQHKQRNEYPEYLYFRTEKNQYLKSYWIRLLGISFGAKFSECTAIWRFAHDLPLIEINYVNADGVEITVPVCFRNRKFDVYINHQVFHFDKYTSKKITFKEINGKIVCNKFTYTTTDRRKGCGLLHVYLGPMEIGVSDLENQKLVRVAKMLSSPLSNGYYNKISVNYPICQLNQIRPLENVKNYILIGGDMDTISKQAKIDLQKYIKTSLDGFTYQQTKFSGKYCVMQIVPHPKDLRKSILLIQANDEKMLGRNMFTRKLVIPFLNGPVHEFLNNEALIFYNNKYLGVYEWGEPIKEL